MAGPPLGSPSPPATDTPAFAVRAVAVQTILEDAVRLYRDRPALDFMGRRCTYGELGALVDRAAAGLQAIGVVKGDRVGLCLPNTPYSVIFYFAILAVGATVVNYNPLYVARELEHQIRDSGTSVMIAIDLAEIHAKLVAAGAAAGLRRIVLCPLADALPVAKAALYRLLKRKARVLHMPRDGMHVAYKSLMAGSAVPRPVAIDPDADIAVLQYTGGTTGTPKGAILTHTNVVANCDQIKIVFQALRPGEERIMAVLPLFHVFAMTTVMNVGLAFGAELILLPRFVLRQCLDTLARRKVTVFPAVPTIYAAIAKEAEKTKFDLSAIRLCISGGAPLAAEVRRDFERATGCRINEGYGLTEAAPVVSCNPALEPIREGSVGRPLPGTRIAIRDRETGAPLLEPGEKGEIVVEGPQVMRGYWNQPAETAAVFDGTGLRTGDIGYLDDDGYVFVVDRIKDVILCGGFNVYPRVLEDALYQHPAVAEAVVIGVSDPYRGQVPKGFVVLRAGQDATPAALLDFLAGYVSRIEMRSKTIEIRAVLPPRRHPGPRLRLRHAARHGTRHHGAHPALLRRQGPDQPASRGQHARLHPSRAGADDPDPARKAARVQPPRHQGISRPVRCRSQTADPDPRAAEQDRDARAAARGAASRARPGPGRSETARGGSPGDTPPGGTGRAGAASRRASRIRPPLDPGLGPGLGQADRIAVHPVEDVTRSKTIVAAAALGRAPFAPPTMRSGRSMKNVVIAGYARSPFTLAKQGRPDQGPARRSRRRSSCGRWSRGPASSPTTSRI